MGNSLHLTATTPTNTQSKHAMDNMIRDDNFSQLLETIGKERNETKFAELFKHFAPLIKGFVIANNANMTPHTAEELVQEVMIKVWNKAPTFDASKSSANTWIFTITRNARIDYFRKNSRHNINSQPIETTDIWDEDIGNQPFVYLHDVRKEEQVAALLKDLPAEQSRCLKKVYMEGKSHTEIADELKLPLGTVKSRVRLGLKKLQAALLP